MFLERLTRGSDRGIPVYALAAGREDPYLGIGRQVHYSHCTTLRRGLAFVPGLARGRWVRVGEVGHEEGIMRIRPLLADNPARGRHDVARGTGGPGRHGAS